MHIHFKAKTIIRARLTDPNFFLHSFFENLTLILFPGRKKIFAQARSSAKYKVVFTELDDFAKFGFLVLISVA